ncbi:MAG: D-alanyl-D-alanine carboxypeptidase/D-alanyl-D-alanine-endopeptidase [Syntrophobacter sp.]
MKKIFVQIPVILCCLSAILFYPRIGASAGYQERGVDFQQSLEGFRKAAGKVGVMLVSLPSGQVDFEYRSRDPFVPASLVKLLTSYTALKKLGPEFRFRTEIFARSEPSGGIIQGDIWIKGYGDPFLVPEKIQLLVQALKDRGIRQITGSVYADNSFFSPGAEHICLDSDCIGVYNPVVSPTAMDFNLVTLRLTVPTKAGQTVTIDSPSGNYARVSGRAVSGSSKKGGQPLKVRSLGANGSGQEEFQVSGQGSPKGPRLREFRFHAADPAGLSAHTLRAAAERAGIRIQGRETREGAVPPGSVTIARYESPQLSELVSSMNKYSNNFMAEMLLKGLAGHLAGPPGTTQKGVALVRAALNEARVPTDTGMLDCGSGLSRFCLLTPEAFCRLLMAAWQDPAIGSAFLSSLAANAEEGTLRRRMRKPGLTVRGKTGTLNDVIGFAGYVSGPSGKTYAVTVMLNDVRDRSRARQAIDTFLEDVASSQ